MIVVSDTSPLNYLILVGEVDVLPKLFGRVVAPTQVIAELCDSRSPEVVRAWAQQPPSWLEVRSDAGPLPPGVGPGEGAAIALARELHADFVLIDERRGHLVATSLGLDVLGLIGVLLLAGERSLLDINAVGSRLSRTSFRATPEIWELLGVRRA